MSNLIKAYNIRYEEKIKPLDLNERAEELKKSFLEKDRLRKAALRALDLPVDDDDEPGFTPLEFPEVEEADEADLLSRDMGYGDSAYSGTGYDDLNGQYAAQYDAQGGNYYSEAEPDPVSSAVEDNKLILEQMEARIIELQQQADTILSKAYSDAESILAEARAKANEVSQEMFENAKREGYEAGSEAARAELMEGQQKLNTLEQQLRESYEKQVNGLEPAFIEMLIRYVKKITGVLIDDRRDIVTYIIDRFMKKQDSVSGCIVRVSPDDYEAVRASINKLDASLPKDCMLEIVEDKLLTKTQCLIECDSKLFDISLENDLNGLIEDLKLFLDA